MISLWAKLLKHSRTPGSGKAWRFSSLRTMARMVWIMLDGHRTVALAISPYIRRESIDSTFYSHPSILKTIELMLGLPTLSLFDLIANDMRAGFTSSPDFTPYDAVMPQQSLFEVNPPLNGLKGNERRDARASMK